MQIACRIAEILGVGRNPPHIARPRYKKRLCVRVLIRPPPPNEPKATVCHFVFGALENA
jgi:hypothetical protein